MCLGIPGQIVAIVDAQRQLATVDVGGVRRTVNVAFIVDAAHPVHGCLGQWVLVHIGFAMSRIDAQEAERTLALLTELGEAQAGMAMGEMRSDTASRADTQPAMAANGGTEPAIAAMGDVQPAIAAIRDVQPTTTATGAGHAVGDNGQPA